MIGFIVGLILSGLLLINIHGEIGLEIFPIALTPFITAFFGGVIGLTAKDLES